MQELLTDGKKAGEKHNIHRELYPDFMSPLKSAIDYFTVQPRKKKMCFHVLANLLHITMLLLETDFAVLTLALQYISTEGQN